MKEWKKFVALLCAVALLLCVTGCAPVGSFSTPKGHVPTISENIETLRNQGYRIQQQHYCSVKSIVESGTGHVAELSGESVSPTKIMRITLNCPSHGNTVMSDPEILYPGGSAVTVGQSCCIVTCADSFSGYSVKILVFGG